MEQPPRALPCEENLRELTRDYDKHAGESKINWKVQHRWNHELEKRMAGQEDTCRAKQPVQRSEPSSESQKPRTGLIALLLTALVGAFELIKLLLGELVAG